MNDTRFRNIQLVTGFPILSVLLCYTLIARSANSQNPEVQQPLAELKQSMAKNKQPLAQCSWSEQDIISLKGEEKKGTLPGTPGPGRQTAENQPGPSRDVRRGKAPSRIKGPHRGEEEKWNMPTA